MSIFKKISILSLVFNLNIAPLNNFVYSIEQEDGDDEPTMDTGEVIFKQIDEDDELYDKYDSQEDNNNQNSDEDIVFRRLEDDENPDDENYQDFNGSKDYQITESDKTAIEEISSGMIRVIVSADDFSIIEEYEGLNKEPEKEPESEPTSVSADETTIYKNDEKIDSGKIEKNPEDISSEGIPVSIKNENNEELTENVVSFMDAEDNDKENNEEKSSVVSFMDSSEENTTQENEKNNTNNEIFIREIKDENDEEIYDNNTDSIIENKNPDKESVNNEENNSEELSSKENVSSALISEYNGMYILQYPSLEEANAAVEYYNTYANFAVLDMVVFINQDEETTPEEEIISETEMDEESNPFKELETAVDENLESVGSVVSYKKKIAVIDTGNNYSEIPTVSMLGDAGSDLNGHGTKMIDYIQAENPDVDIIAIKALGDDGKGDISAVYAGIMYAIEAGVDVINMSFNAFSTSENAVLKDAVLKANEAGIKVVVSAGNNGIDAKYFTPSGIDEAIVIGSAIQNEDTVTKQSFSNYGETVDYYVLSDSTSEGAARFSGLLSSVGIDEIDDNINNEIVFVFDNSYTVSINNNTDIADSEIIDSSEPVEPNIDDINTSGEFEANTLTRTWNFAFNGSSTYDSETLNAGTGGSPQQFTAPYHANYKLEVWGGWGGPAGTASYAADSIGGYSYGNVGLTKDTTIYVVVGGRGGEGDDSNPGTGGYNGGGAGGKRKSTKASGGGGGGATHIATTTGTLSSLSSNKSAILIVAGGGGGASGAGSILGSGNKGGTGGGTSGGNGAGDGTPAGGTQTSGYAFGQGQSAVTKSSGYGGNGGGGGGYYGGYASQETGRKYAGGGGGSGYLSAALESPKATSNGSTSNYNSNISSTSNKNTYRNGYAKISFVSLISGNFVVFNLNGYSLPEFEGNETYVAQGDSIELPDVNRDFYYFLGWSTSTSAANIVSSPYIPTATASTVTLYAIWDKIPDTYLASGSVVNQKLKSLENSTAIVDSIDITTQSFERVYNPPVNETTVDISKNQDESVLAWESGGVIKWYTDAEFVNMDTDSSKMFYNFQKVSSIDLTGFKSASVSNMKGMFSNCISLNAITLSTTFSFSGNSISSVENKALLPEVPNISPYDGKWFLGNRTYTSEQMRDNNPQTSYSGTYAWHELSNLTKTTYACTASYQTFTAPKDGKYQLEVYGAQGGFSGKDGNVGASINTTDYQKGGYSKGRMTLNASQTLYIAVGCKGGNGQGAKNDDTVAGAGGWNGGGNGGKPVKDAFYTTYPGGGGGGATSIQTTLRGDGQLKNYSNNRSDVLIVAGGAGGIIYAYTNTSALGLIVYDIIYGGAGGGLEGSSEDGREYKNIDSWYEPALLEPGTQTSGYAFGQGQSAANKTTDDTVIPGNEMGNSGGGGGWYGGRASQVTVANNSANNYSVGTGGSGYLNPVLSNASTVMGRKTGDGQAIITELASGYHIQFNTGAGQFSNGTTQKVLEITNSGSGYAIDPASVGTPTSTSGSFAGWYTDPVLGTEVNLNQIDETYDERILYAKYEPSYTITLNPNEGSVSPTSVTVNPGNVASLPTPTRSGYICTGWYTDSTGGIKRADAGGSYTPTASETLYAQWSNSYTISFNIFPSLPNDNLTLNVTPGQSVTLPDNPAENMVVQTPLEDEAYININLGSFSNLIGTGWYTSYSDGTKRGDYNATYIPTQSETLVTHYKTTNTTQQILDNFSWAFSSFSGSQPLLGTDYWTRNNLSISQQESSSIVQNEVAISLDSEDPITDFLNQYSGRPVEYLVKSSTDSALFFVATGTGVISSQPISNYISFSEQENIAYITDHLDLFQSSSQFNGKTPTEIWQMILESSSSQFPDTVIGIDNNTCAILKDEFGLWDNTLFPDKYKNQTGKVLFSAYLGNIFSLIAGGDGGYDLMFSSQYLGCIRTLNKYSTFAGNNYFIGSETDDVSISTSILKISQGTPASATAPTAKSLTYNGSTQTLANAATNVVGGTVQYALGTNGTTAPTSGWSTSVPTATNTGTYYVWWKIIADTGYTDKEPAYIGTASTIAQREVTITAPTAVSGTLTYNGSAKTLANTGSCTAGGTMYYYVSTSSTAPAFSTSTWKTTIDQKTDVGTYYIHYYCYVSDTTNNKSSTTSGAKAINTAYSISKAISKATPTLTLSATSGTLTYPNTGTFTITSNPSGGTLSVASGTTSVATATISGTTVTLTPAVVSSDGGTSIITITSDATGNYNAATATYTATVNRGTITLTPTSLNGTYTGSEQYAKIKSDVAGVTIVSGTSTSYGNSVTTNATANTNYNLLPGYTNYQESTTIYYKATKAGYKDATGSTTATISKANSSATAPTSKSSTFSGSAQALANAATNVVGGTVQYAKGTSGTTAPTSGWDTSVPTETNAGTYYVWWKIVGDSNHSDKSATYVGSTSVISKATNPIAVTATQSGSVSFSTSAQSKSFTAATNAQGGVTYSISSQKQGSTTVNYFTIPTNSTATFNVAANTPAGTYTIVFSANAAGNSNYESGSKDITYTLTVDKVTPTLTLSATSGTLTYPNTGTFTVTSNPSGGTLSVASGTTSVATASISGTTVTITPVAVTSDGGTSVITVTSAANGSYNATTATYTVTVNRGTLGAVTATDKTYEYDGSAKYLDPVTCTTSGTIIAYGTTSGTYNKSSITDSTLGQTSVGPKTIYYNVSKDGYIAKSGNYTLTVQDTTSPSPSITSTNNVADSQTVTLSATDLVGVTSYYWGTKANPTTSDYTTVSSATSWSTTTTVNTSGTYYLFVKDNAGNVNSANKAFYNTNFTVSNGSTSISSVITMSGNSFNTPNITPNTGYSSPSKWSYGTSSTVNAGSSYTPSSNNTLTAICTANTNTAYTVYHYQKDLGSTSYTLKDTDNLTGTSDASLTLANLKKTTYAGFTYDAGYLTGGTARPSSGATTTTTIAPDGTRKIYLYYIRNTHKVTLTAGTGIASVTGANNSVEFGAAVSINATLSDGYNWSKWTNTSGGSQVSTTQNLTFTMPDNDVAYTANGVLKTYTVSYDANGGSGAPSNQTKTHGTDLTLSSTKPTKADTTSSWTVNFELGNHGTSTGATNNKLTPTTTTKYTFSNWTSSSDSATYNTGATYSVNAATTMTANYTSNTTSAAITLPTPTGSAGYEFDGWYNGSTKAGNAGVSYTPSANNQTLTAHWKTITYTISYDLNKGTGSTTPSHSTPKTSYDVESAAFTLVNPTRTGYIFAGWTGSNGTTAQTSVSVPTGTTGNLSYTANWTPKSITYNVVYKSSSDKSLGTETIAKNFDTTNTVAAPDKAGYTTPASQSVAWNSETAKTITFTYTPITYDISYTNNGGSHSNPTSYNVESADITLADATKTGYTFTGWTGNGTTTPTKSLKLVSGSTGNKTYTANFTANTTTPYTVYHYQKNLGSTAYTLIDTDNLTGTSDASLTLANLKKTTYTGFTYDAGYLTGGTTRPTSGATTTTTIAPDGTRKIYLYYTRNTHRVTLTAGTGIASVTGANNSVEFGASVSINATLSEGYIWSEWTNTSGGSQVSTTKNYTFTMPDNDVSYTANTVLKTYTVSYDANGGSGAPSSQTKTHGTDLTLSSTKPTKTNTFVSWSTNFEVGDHGTSTGATNNTISSTATTTYTFTNWSSSADSQTYNAGGTYSYEASTVMTANYSSSTSGASITLPTPTAETGYHFTGWYNSSTRIGGAGESWTPANNNQTLTAHWEANTYTVVYNKNGGSGSMSNSEFTYNVSGNLTANGFTAPSGYSFGGWADSVAHATSGTVYRANSAAHGNMITTNGAIVNLYAIWKRNITFYSGNNKATATTVIQYYDGANSIGANITTPSSATCVDITGWTELGWRDDITAGTKEIDFNVSITPTSTSYYAVYSRDVTFYSGVNKEHSETQSQYYNTDGEYSVVTPTPVSISIGEGWEQRGWVITTEAKEGDTAAGETDSHNSSKYNAVYRRQLSINYSNNTRTRSVPPTTTEYQYYNTDSGVSTPEFTLAENTFEKTGYTFSKWDLGPEGSIYNDWTPEVDDTTLTKTANAEWNAITYIVHYNANGGSGTTMADSTFTYDSDETLTANSYSAPTDIGDNWSFGGWALSVADANNGTVARTDRATHGNLSTTQDDEVTLYAIWKRTITFKSGSKQATSTQAIEYRNTTASASSVVIPAGTASLTGWTFSGWREDTNADTAVYNATGAISPTATTLYAVYTRTATFYSGINKATTATATQYRNTGTASAEVWSVTIPNAPTAITFWTTHGWRTDTTADNKVFDPTGTITAEAGPDFYAVYSRNLTLSYNGNGNTGGTAPTNGTFTQKYNTDSAITTPSFTLANNTFTKTNYVFNNWDLGAPGSVYTAWNPAMNDTIVTKTATAQWSRQNNVSVICQVSGNMGSRDKRFTYTTSFVNTDIPYANQTINYTLNGSAQTLTLNGSSEGTIELSSNDIAIFQNIREGTVFTITQEDYATDGYSVNHLTASETLTNSDYSVTFTNTNVTAVPTGVNGHNPFATAIIFLTGILGIIYIGIKRTLSKKES